VRVVTDSAASLPAELIAEHGVTVVPMRIVVGGQDHPDGELALGEVVDRVREGVSTSAPSPGEFARAIGSVMSDDGVVVATVASTMSATFTAARLAGDGWNGSVRVVDTHTAAGAQGLVVLAAAVKAAMGGSLEEVEGTARAVADRVHLVAAVAGLEHLVLSGRVPGVAGWAGRRLGIQPLFEFREGKAHPLRPAKSRERALERMVQRLEHSRTRPSDRLHVAALHAMAEDEADELLTDVGEIVEPATSFVAEFSSVMVTHTGPRLVGLAWWWEEAHEPESHEL
jgi:DegV family protein with EDD domain